MLITEKNKREGLKEVVFSLFLYFFFSLRLTDTILTKAFYVIWKNFLYINDKHYKIQN